MLRYCVIEDFYDAFLMFVSSQEKEKKNLGRFACQFLNSDLRTCRRDNVMYPLFVSQLSSNFHPAFIWHKFHILFQIKMLKINHNSAKNL